MILKSASAASYACADLNNMTLIRPITVRALPKYRIYLQFSDGAQGEVDLSGLVGKGVFKAWNNLDFFGQVHLAPHRAIQWSAEIELCPDALS
jgi:hypothetical protein